MGKKKGKKRSMTKDAASGAAPSASVQTDIQATPQPKPSGDIASSVAPLLLTLTKLLQGVGELKQALPTVVDTVRETSRQTHYVLQVRADNHNIAIENAHRLASLPICQDPLKLLLHPLANIHDMANPEIPGFPPNLAELEALDDNTATFVLKALATIRPCDIINSNAPANIAYKKAAIRSRWIAVLPTVHEIRKARRRRCRHPRTRKSGHRAASSRSFYGPEPEQGTVQGEAKGSQTEGGPVSK